MIGLVVLSYSMDEIMKMYGGVFLYSNPLGSYEQSKFSRLVANFKNAIICCVDTSKTSSWAIELSGAHYCNPGSFRKRLIFIMFVSFLSL